MQNLSIDTETTGLNLYKGCAPFAVSACDNNGETFYWTFRVNPSNRKVIYNTSEARRTIRDMIDVLKSYKVWSFHNALYDLKALDVIAQASGMKCISAPEVERDHDIHDSQLQAHLFNALVKLGLKEQGVMRLDFPADDETELCDVTQKAAHIAKKHLWYVATVKPTHPTLLGSKANYHADYWVPHELVLHNLCPPKYINAFSSACRTYAVKDVERTQGLNLLYYVHTFTDAERELYNWHRQVLWPIYRIQSKGFRLNPDKLYSTITRFKQQRGDMLAEMRRLTRRDFDPQKPAHLAEALFQKFELPPVKMNKTGPSTDKDCIKVYLSTVKDKKTLRFLKSLDVDRKSKKTLEACTTYKNVQVDGRLHTSINITGTKTVRVSSKNPNTQNIAKKSVEGFDESEDAFSIREVFGPDDQHEWYAIDYQQLQIRIFAFAANDRQLIRGFEQGYDAHTFVATRMYKTDTPDDMQRRAAKYINFGILFGAGPAKIESMSGVPGSYDLFVKQFPNVHIFIKDCERTAKRKGIIYTMGGYPLRVPYKTAYKAANYKVQGTEGEMVKEAMIQVDKYLQSKDYGVDMNMQIHDELVFEAIRGRLHKKTISYIGKLMIEAGAKYGVKCEVDCKRTRTDWASASSFKLAL